ncbi:hypothetical protein JCM10914A_50840 [Paenibacillus sp. JCM 10914]|uniref:MauE/DoxX family redox-associated membrane protein n=1 Tax=Paenibacillus sp. JCM 10914 TaxID=1236974 RepID=UPI0003CC54B1|nr:hypothetical protein [Paenibacillus sp. JCM 10914]GAE05218.1 hypothetical protein JCM10914_1311 [Paenibacillus sp. JCM 10914]
MYELLILPLTLPMLLSVTGYAWGRIFADVDPFPGTARTHALLILAQTLSLILVYVYQAQISLFIISMLYFIQGVGVVYFLATRGKVDCGCLGPQVRSQLGVPLVALNVFMGMLGLGLGVWGWIELDSLIVWEGLLQLFMLLLLALLLIVGIPDGRHAISLYRKMAAPHDARMKREKEGQSA